jgi:nitroreductase
MELTQVIEQRESVRKYREDAVPKELIEWIIEIASQAPSAGGLKAYRVIITEKQLTSYKAPFHLVICAMPNMSGQRYGKRGRSLYAIQDATIVGAYIQLLAVDMALSTVWVGAFREGQIKRQLGLDDELRPIALMPIGYAES